MDFKGRKHKTQIEVNNDSFTKSTINLQLYKDPPTTQITLAEFEELAIERLRVLRVLEMVNLKKTANNFEEWRKSVEEELRRQCSKSYFNFLTSPRKTDDDVQQRDYLSHFILRLAYCQSEEYRRWFISKEIELFKFRWSCLSHLDQKHFLEMNEMNFIPLDSETRRNLSVKTGNFIKPENVDYYCVKWTDVLDSVRNRRTYIENGKAYITSVDLIAVLISTFRTNLSYSLVLMSHKLHIIQEDERIKRLVTNLHSSYTGKNYAVNYSNKKNVSLHNLDTLSVTSFPMCMKQLNLALKTNHHLRHFGRQQFSLFLKGIGLSLEDALIFWKSEFTKKIDVDQYEKKYAYNIRHNYGKEGKRTNYTPYSCIKIIGSNPGPGEYHGCPFKHNDVQSLKQTFSSQRIPAKGIEDILYYVNLNQYQLACAKYFEITHNASIPTGVNHPNQYFEESQKVLSGENLSNLVSQNVSKPVSTSGNINKTPSDILNDAELEGVFDDNFDILNE